VGKNKYYAKKRGGKLILLPILALLAICQVVVAGGGENTSAASSAITETVVNINSVIGISAPSTITVDMGIPTTAGKFASGSGTIQVSTNDPTGYSVYLTGTNGGSVNLVHENAPAVSSVFTPIGSTQTISGGTTKFSVNNTWGWSSNGSTYYPLKAYGQKHTSSVTTRYRRTNASTISGGTMGTDSSTLTIGATANTAMTAGSYSTHILLTAVANSDSAISDYDTTL